HRTGNGQGPGALRAVRFSRRRAVHVQPDSRRAVHGLAAARAALTRIPLPSQPHRGWIRMASSEADNLVPVRIVAHQASHVLELEYGDGRSFRLPFEFLRVYSPSAEVRGHGPGQEVLQVGKAEVGIVSIE